ncbi:MAG TPA: diaminopimelate epimerase [Candidatus Atribacteria bacterium]|nr:diaminopimelate epimerase [Candidatus Atribacteria bacterium]
MRFVKMHGLGNDFVIFPEEETEGISSWSSFSLKACDRHRGVGGDGVILVLSSSVADLRMRIFNSDGSEAEMCGNGVRCLAKFAFERGMVNKKEFTVETKAGVIILRITEEEKGKVKKVRVNLGRPRFQPREIPVALEEREVKNYPLEVGDRIFLVSALSLGNPHVVIFEIPPHWEEYGREIENHPLFPEKTNVEFVEVKNNKEAVVKVWERGAGATLACGTGAAASLIAGVREGKLDRKANIYLPGGPLEVEWQEEVYIEGPAEEVFEGEINEEVEKEWKLLSG